MHFSHHHQHKSPPASWMSYDGSRFVPVDVPGQPGSVVCPLRDGPVADSWGWKPPKVRSSPDNILPWATGLQRLPRRHCSHGRHCLLPSVRESPSPKRCTRGLQQPGIVTRPRHGQQRKLVEGAYALTTSHGWAICFFFWSDRKLVQAAQLASRALSAIEEKIFVLLTKQIESRVR